MIQIAALVLAAAFTALLIYFAYKLDKIATK